MNNSITHRLLAEDITDLFYTKEDDEKNQEGGRGSIRYWNHVYAIEDIITQFIQGSDLTLDNDG